MKNKPLVLCILDGWGISSSLKYNAISNANTAFIDSLIENYPNTIIETSGEAVGLPKKQMGNSEIGHMTISSGRIIINDLQRINKSIEDESLHHNTNLIQFVQKIYKDKSCHLMGLFSNGGVHSQSHHIIFLAKFLAKQNIKIQLHLFTDGRDTKPYDIIDNKQILKDLLSDKNINIATLSGRYYAMDRDNRWDRIEKAYNAIVLGEGIRFDSLDQAIDYNYQNKNPDEFIIPSVIGDYNGINENDSLLMTNFRSDRVIQILLALLVKDFVKFNRKKAPIISSALGIVEYSDELNDFINHIFAKNELKNTFPQVIADKNYKQLRIAETEKYPHVTYFFNGGKDFKFKNEDRILIDSKKNSTYDECPEMSAYEITKVLLDAIELNSYDVIIVNYANGDMVGHTGNFEKTVLAIETIDKCLKLVKDKIDQKAAYMIITADHGNAEEMFNDDTGLPHTSHTTNPVPLIIVGPNVQDLKLRAGRLCDIAPTVLNLMKIEKPKDMTGISLIYE